jgi:hypothetical protein
VMMGFSGMSSDALTIIGILLSVIGVLISIIVGLKRSLPKLIGTGTSSSSMKIQDKDLMVSSITIRNKPTFLGKKVSRGPAKIRSARLYDPKLKELVGPSLLWRGDKPNEYEIECTIEPGASKQLHVLAKERYAEGFFQYTKSYQNVEWPSPSAIYRERRRAFSVHLYDSIGRQYKFNIIARNSDQSVHLAYKKTMHMRCEMIRDAFRSLRRALTP